MVDKVRVRIGLGIGRFIGRAALIIGKFLKSQIMLSDSNSTRGEHKRNIKLIHSRKLNEPTVQSGKTSRVGRSRVPILRIEIRNQDNALGSKLSIATLVLNLKGISIQKSEHGLQCNLFSKFITDNSVLAIIGGPPPVGTLSVRPNNRISTGPPLPSRVRFTSSRRTPKDNHLHLPISSGSNSILQTFHAFGILQILVRILQSNLFGGDIIQNSVNKVGRELTTSTDTKLNNKTVKHTSFHLLRVGDTLSLGTTSVFPMYTRRNKTTDAGEGCTAVQLDIT